MSWCTTVDADQFAAVADGYLRARAAENALLLSSVQEARRAAERQPGLLLGWWEPSDGGAPRGAFVHDPAAPLLIAGRAPELGAALAAALAKMGRPVGGVDAPTEVADAFAAAWSQRAGSTVQVHRNCRVYRLASTAGTSMSAWPSAAAGPGGRLRCAGAADQALLADWLGAAAAEMAERTIPPADLAAELISYGGALLWEVPRPPGRRGDAGTRAVALATLSRPVAGTVRIAMVYTPQNSRRHGYATALTLAVTGAVLDGAGLAGAAPGEVGEVVLITDKSRSDRWGSRLGYQLVGERVVLRFGPVTGAAAGTGRRARATGGLPRLPTGPLPRLPRLRG